MSIEAITTAWKYAPAKGGNLLVLLALADFADEHGWSYPSVLTLSRKSRMSERAVQYAISQLIESGWVSISRGTGPHGVNRYHVPVGVQNLRGAKRMSQIAPDPSGSDLLSPDPFLGEDPDPDPDRVQTRDQKLHPFRPATTFEEVEERIARREAL